MAEKSLLLEVVTPDRQVVSTEVDIVVAPGVEGQFGVLVNHIPFLSALEIGEMYYRKGGQVEYIFIGGGFAEVTGAKVTILADSAERGKEIDIERAKRARERAEKRLAMGRTAEIDWARAEAALRRSISRMKVAGR
ncbi:F0F1 ATP synthase subunit epsilon [Desulfobacca acetoxidans]|uniref:ATP synthase epsilon chain n=1 Tax=Desulfobacca acetoxidans (strain ATCC 700848 / DSM 11109 / ASRB2) TaxID=880072 RepID=F2NDK3_DESAR|nr:F0F1 ATP synthase subunit epsilon [Desulfobacca acetoxidans]AEB10279.1 ATP synthase epsilon chain [Desulfobacca acetoxidans DSM 11109]HAY21983.1 F0F1 ATP synthase subunit epsilon [Desulfobacterales bacterium]